MQILGLDPSTRCIGWTLLEWDTELNLQWLSSWGAIRPEGDNLDAKLASAADQVGRMLMANPVDAVAIEMPVVYRNPATTIKLAQLVGALRYVAFQASDRTIEITPGGRLTALGLPMNLTRPVAKELVLNTINALYKRRFTPEQHDIADAAAVAHAAWVQLKKEKWENEH